MTDHGKTGHGKTGVERSHPNVFVRGASSASDSDAVDSLAIELSSGTVQIDRYRLLEALGVDACGIHYAAIDMQTGAPVVLDEYFPPTLATRGDDGMTVVPKTRRDQKALRVARTRFEAETTMLAEMEFPAVGRCHGFVESGDTLWRITDPVPASARSIRQWIENDCTALGDDQIRAILHAVLPVLESVHNLNALHRGITPDAILLSRDGEVTFTGFGATRYMIAEKNETLRDVLEPGFAPFEFLQRRDHQGPSSDLYSLAATLYYAMTGLVPAAAVDRFEAAQNREPDPLVPLRIIARDTHDADLNRLVDDMLSLRVQDRPARAALVYRQIDEGQMPTVLLSMRDKTALCAPNAVVSESQAGAEQLAMRESRRARRRVTAAVLGIVLFVTVLGLGGLQVLSPEPSAIAQSVAPARVSGDDLAPPRIASSSAPVEGLIFAARDAMAGGQVMDGPRGGALALLERALGEAPGNELAVEGINHMLHFFVMEKQRAESSGDAIGLRLVNRNLRRIRLRHPESRPVTSGGFFEQLKARQRIGAITAGDIDRHARDFVN